MGGNTHSAPKETLRESLEDPEIDEGLAKRLAIHNEATLQGKLSEMEDNVAFHEMMAQQYARLAETIRWALNMKATGL